MTVDEMARLLSRRDEVLTELIAALLARVEALEGRIEAMEARETEYEAMVRQ